MKNEAIAPILTKKQMKANVKIPQFVLTPSTWRKNFGGRRGAVVEEPGVREENVSL